MTAIRTLRRRLPARRRPRPIRLGARRAQAVFNAAAGPVAVHLPAHMITGQCLRDGETILLAIKPSRVYIFLSSFPFIAGVLLALVAINLCNLPHLRYFADAASFAIASRVMWAILNWMGRLYVLTDQRILRLSGVLQVEIADCPLRKVAGTAVVGSFGERIFRLGSVAINPAQSSIAAMGWQTLRRPEQIEAQIDAAIRRAKQSGGLAQVA